MSAPVVAKVSHRTGVAGQLAYVATVRYPGEEPSEVTFVGSVYGGPVLMQTAGFPDGVFVTDPGRFGTFGKDWVVRFFE